MLFIRHQEPKIFKCKLILNIIVNLSKCLLKLSLNKTFGKTWAMYSQMQRGKTKNKYTYHNSVHAATNNMRISIGPRRN